MAAVAEPKVNRRRQIAKEHNIPPKYQFKSWEDLLFKDKFVDAVIISTNDKLHFKPLINSLKKGYRVLCEKPITDQYEELQILKEDYKNYSNNVMVSHVLRYTPFFRKIKEIISKKKIGQIRFINLIENIGFFHYGHSYVRGNWRNKKISSPIILAKSCHDLDILYWLLDSKYKRVYSDSSELYFDLNNIPKRAGQRCLECDIEKDCPYSARKLYFKVDEGWPVSVITDDLSKKGRIKALNETNYGRCVYRSDNDQLDVQSLLLRFKNDISAHFTLTAFSKEMTRKINIFGSKGEIEGNLDKGIINVKPFIEENKKIEIPFTGGHAGGDEKLMDAFEDFLLNGTNNNSNLLSALESHFAGLAAERSRDKKRAINLLEFKKYHK